MNYLVAWVTVCQMNEEKFTLDEMIQSFDIQRISLGGPVFGIEKLYWLNGEYLRTIIR